MKYKTVVIDPPWNINGLTGEAPMIKGNRKPIYRDTASRIDYKLIPNDTILDFDIEQWADDECYMFLWVTNGKSEKKPVIQIGLELLEKWGFTYHSIITWFKHQGMAFRSPIRTASEHCLFAYRGGLKHQTYQMDSVIETSYQIKASQKPARFYQLLRAWTPEPRIDIFARNAHEGFDGWGDEYVGEGALAPYLKEKMK